MSDTDDTDVLLLIPPNFFLIHTDSEDEKHYNHCDPHRSVVDTLISHVHRLESRVNKIEINSEQSYNSSISSCNSTIIPMSEMSDQPYRNNENYIPSIAKSTPHKPKGKFNVTSVPSTPSSERPGSQKYRRPPRFTSRYPPSKFPPRVQNQSTDADESSFSATPKKEDNKQMLGEIDQFLSNVKTIQKVASRKALDDKQPRQTKLDGPQIKVDEPVLTLNDLKTGKDESVRRFSQLNLKDVDRLLQAIETQEKYMDFQDSKIESLYQNQNFSKDEQSQSWSCGDVIGSVPDIRYEIRDHMYSKEKIRKEEPRNIQNERRDSKSDSQSNSELTFQTVLENRSTIPNFSKNKSSPAFQNTIPDKISTNQVKKTQSERQSTKFTPESDSSNEAYEIRPDLDGIHILPTAVKSLPANINNTLQFSQPSSSLSSINLFSLADIWNSNGSKDLKISDLEMKKLLPKLEEERCKRKHCENLIQDLQMQILGMQQHLAVAVQVDSVKDEAILRFHEAWEKVANRWKSLESERNSLSQKLLAIEEKSSTDLAEVAQKVVHYELEISKALNLAHNNQERCNALEMEKGDYIRKLTEIKLELKTSQNNLNEISKEKEKLSEKISILERESLQDKKLLLTTQNEVAKSKSVFLNCQNELSILKDNYIKLEKKIKDKQNLIHELESQKNNLHVSLENMQKTELHLQHKIKNLQDDSERTKHDLRDFYQKQVEGLVKDKVIEYQEQLKLADKLLEDELYIREQSVAKTAARQMQKLCEKHRLEIHLIEEKHKEEIKLYELQFNQMEQQIHMLQTKIDSYKVRRSTIAQELHTVMEQQWLEALRIINNGKSPGSSSPRPQGDIAEPTHNFSLKELRKILSANENVANKAKDPKIVHFDPKLENNEKSNVKVKSKYDTDQPFQSLQHEVFKKPGSSKRKEESLQNSENELQKYVKMMIDKLPKTDCKKLIREERKFQIKNGSNSGFVDDSSSCHQSSSMPALQKTDDKSNQTICKEQRSGKRPWK